MQFALIFIGLVFVVTGVRGTQNELAEELRDDLVGSGNFIYWVISIMLIGSLGYIDALRTFSRYFLALVLLSIVLANRGFFDNFMKAIQGGPETVEPKESNGNDGPIRASIDESPIINEPVKRFNDIFEQAERALETFRVRQ